MAQTPGRSCPNCGGPIAAGQRFCTNCGTVLEAPPPSQYGGMQQQNYPPAQQPPPYVQQPPPYAQPQQQLPPYMQQPQQKQSPIAEAFGALGLLFLLRRFGRGYTRGYVPRRQSSGCCGCLVLLVILLVVLGLPGYFAFRSRIPALQNTINSISSGNTGGPLATQPPITTVQINETVPYSGVEFTVVDAQQSKAFLDDNSTGTNGMLRLNIKESNTTSSGANYVYGDAARLILPDKSTVAPANEKQFSGPDAGTTRTNWLDFQVPTSDQISQLTLQLGTDTQAQEDIPLTGNANLSQYQPKTAHPNITTQYAGLNWTVTSVEVALSLNGRQADKGTRYVTMTFKVDNPTAHDFSAYWGDYFRLQSGGTTSAPDGSTNFPIGFPAGSSGTTGNVTFVMPQGSTAYTLILLGKPSAYPPISQSTTNFQVA